MVSRPFRQESRLPGWACCSLLLQGDLPWPRTCCCHSPGRGANCRAAVAELELQRAGDGWAIQATVSTSTSNRRTGSTPRISIWSNLFLSATRLMSCVWWSATSILPTCPTQPSSLLAISGGGQPALEEMSRGTQLQWLLAPSYARFPPTR